MTMMTKTMMMKTGHYQERHKATRGSADIKGSAFGQHKAVLSSTLKYLSTVDLRSKGPATKGNRSLRDNGTKSQLFPFSFLLFGAPARWDTAIRETSLFGKDFSVP